MDSSLFGICNPSKSCHTVLFANSVTVTEDGKKALVTLANGDMRKVLNILQVSDIFNNSLCCFTSF